MLPFARGLLLLSFLVFLGLGIGFLVAPEGMASGIDIVLPTPTARADLMATYGGFEIGFAIFLLLCWRNPAWLVPGLVACGLVFAGFGGARLLGIVQAGGAVKPMLYGFLGIEAVAAALSFGCARALGRS